MNAIVAALALLAFSTGAPVPKITVSPETHVTGPLDKDGNIDFAAAVDEAFGKGIAPEDNAAALLWKAIGPGCLGKRTLPPGFFRKLGIDELPEKGEYFVELDDFLKKQGLSRKETHLICGELEFATVWLWSTKRYPILAKWLKANETSLAVAVEASKRREYFVPCAHQTDSRLKLVAGMDGIHLRTCREIGLALTARAMLRTSEGKFDDAWGDLLACHRLGRLICRGGGLFDVLHGCSVDLMATHADQAFLDCATWNAPQWQKCDRDLRVLPSYPSLADKVVFVERLMKIEILLFIRRNGLRAFDSPFQGKTPEPPTAEEAKTLAEFDWGQYLREHNRRFDQIDAAFRAKTREFRLKALDQLDMEIKDLGPKADLVQQLGGNVDADETTEFFRRPLLALPTKNLWKVQSVNDRAEQSHRIFRIAVALKIHQLEKGRYPAKLEELAPRVAPSEWLDLFSERPLVYRVDGKGYRLYSVGVNGSDDGGPSNDSDSFDNDDLGVVQPIPETRPRD